jgi:hypothetical protein
MSAEQCPDKSWCPKNCLDPSNFYEECFAYLTPQEQLLILDFYGLAVFFDRRPPEEMTPEELAQYEKRSDRPHD